jgi:serine/threonine protein kinase
MDWEAFYNNFRKPDFIPGYEIQHRLGGGAFGDVYKARKQSIGKAYAIKFLKLEDDGQREAVERELAQVRHFAAIDHPNLVTIEDMGTAMDVPYLIMGYAGEDTLARRLKESPLSTDDALLYFTQTCRAVLALHDRRLVHFDLKPSNVFLKGEVARVGDYGLSKLLTDGRMTLSFGRGTPQYMAPEILRSRADHRADIYSLGVMLFESLAGSLPYQPSVEAGLVLREEDTPPDFPADFPAFVRPVVERCLRLDPTDRFGDVGELLEALGQTARQGDSVRVERSEPPESGVPPSGSEPVTDVNKGSGSELRQTAADLARGAAMVARGVWDGLRSSADGDPSPPPPPPESSVELAPPDGVAPDVSGPTTPVGAAIKQELATAKRELAAARDGVRDAGRHVRGAVGQVKGALDDSRERISAGRSAAGEKARALVKGLKDRGPASGSSGSGSSGIGSSGPGAPAAAVSPGGAQPHAVPVPPRVQGGLLGTLAQTAVVGAEVLIALVGNLLRGVLGAFRAVVDRLLRRSGGVVGRVLGVVGFVLFMAGLGFVVMLVGMVFLDAVGVRT